MIALLSNFFDGTGYAQAGNRMALAMDSVGLDVLCRPLKHNRAVCEVPRRVGELLRKTGKVDTVIQHALPHMMVRDSRLGKNIGYFASETSDFRSNNWAERLELMDEVWVINRQMVEACRESGVTRPIRVVPHACDLSLYEKDWGKYPLPFRPGTFVFYYIGECIRRKNLGALLRAYFAEFDPDEPVGLVLKVSHPGSGPEECIQRMTGAVEDILRGTKLQGRAHIIGDRLTEGEIFSLHQACDCFVTTSYGEAWALGAFDAMAMGKTPIVPSSTGFLDWADPSCAYVVPTRPEMVFGADDTFRDLHTGKEWWWAVDHGALRRAMRTAFREQRAHMADRGRARAKRFSFEAVGSLIERALGSHNEKMAGMAALPAGPQG